MIQRRRLPDLPLWSERWDRESLLKKRQAGVRAFARGFHLQAYTDEERMFRSFKSCFVPGLRIAEVQRRGYPVFAGVDLAGKKRPGNVIFCIALDPATQRRYPLEVQRGAWSSPETAQRVADMSIRHRLQIVMVENNGYQTSLIDWIRQSTRGTGDLWMKVEEMTTGLQTKVNPEYGLPSLEVEFHNRAWSIASDEFSEHEPGCQCGWCVWSIEMSDYPMSASTDAVMACFFAREAIERYGSIGDKRPDWSRVNLR